MVKRHRKFLLLLAAGAAALPAFTVLASEAWINFRSSSEIYETRIPANRTVKSTSFPISDTRAVQSEEIVSIVDQRPLKNAQKNYIVKFEQTLGLPLGALEEQEIRKRDIKNYMDFYAGMEGVLRDESDIDNPGYSGKDLTFLYRDPALGIQAMRVKMIYSGTTRLQQIFIGQESALQSYDTRDFFSSLKIKSFIGHTDANIAAQWHPLESPTGMFSLLYPGEKYPPYYTDDPVSRWDDKNEIVTLSFLDPLRAQKIFYNIYGYQSDIPLRYEDAQNILVQRHIMKFRGTTDDVEFKRASFENADGQNIPYIEVKYAIRPLEGFPNVRTARIRASYSGKNMVVQEILSSSVLASAPFADTLMSLVSFHPEKMHPPAQPALYQPPGAPGTATTPADPATAAPSEPAATPAPGAPPAAQ